MSRPTSTRSRGTQVLVVSSGVKSLLDVPATAELLETLGVPVLGWQTDDLPLFYAAHGGPPVSTRVEAASEAARIARAHWQLGGGGLLLGRPPDESLDDVEPLIEEALAEAAATGVRGGAVTPFVLARLHSRERRANAEGEPRPDRGERATRRPDRGEPRASARLPARASRRRRADRRFAGP